MSLVLFCMADGNLLSKKVNNSLHLWSEGISLVEEWISLDSNYNTLEWKFTTQRVEFRPIHSKRSDQWRHYPGSENSLKIHSIF